MATNVTSLAKHLEDSTKWTVEQMLEDALQDSKGEKLEYKKAVVLWLDDSDGQYGISFTQAGMKVSEMVALLDIIKNMLIKSEMEMELRSQ